MKRWRRYGWLLLVASLGLPPRLPAYTVEPNLIALGPGGGESSAFLRLSNKATAPTAVEIVVNEFSRDVEGKGIIGREADDEFIVYPAQLILMPGDEASVQVRWIGETRAGVERVFALTTREVLIPRKDVEAPEASIEGVRINVNVLMNYDVRVYVTPRSARPRVTVETVTVRQQPEHEPDQLEITLTNQGTAHQSLRGLTLVLIPLDQDGSALRLPPVRLDSRDVPGMSAALLAGGRRRLLIPRPAGLPAGPVRVVLSE